MNYKEALLFVGKCLTINYEKENKISIEKQLKANAINWDNVVKLSTAHYVFPALYCNLKRADFLHYLPKDLVEYMQHITSLNRERNKKIVSQAKGINELLLANNITPIFLKGTAFLLQNLYEDIAERMVGDIDFLVAKSNVEKANEVLIKNGYHRAEEYFLPHHNHRHLPRLTKENKIAAVEIHKDMIIKKADNLFNYKTCKDSVIKKDNCCFLSIQNQIDLSCLAWQINDSGYFLKNNSLKVSYDIFLNSLKNTKPKPICQKLFKYTNPFLALSSEVLSTNKIAYKNSKDTEKYVFYALKFKKNRLSIIYYKIKQFYTLCKIRLIILIKSIYNKNYRKFVMSRLKDKNWRKEKIKKLFF